MRNSTPIGNIMKRKPAIVAPHDNLETVRLIFEKHGFHHVPVVLEGKLVGIVSYTDYLRIITELFSGQATQERNQTGLSNILVKEIMTEEVISLKPTDTVEDALEVFTTHHFHAIPVTEGDQRLVGILTTRDLVKLLERLLGPDIDYAGRGNG